MLRRTTPSVFRRLSSRAPCSWSAGPWRSEPAEINSPAELWQGYDPTALDLEIESLQKWEEQGVAFEKLRFTAEEVDGSKVRVFTITGTPAAACAASRHPAHPRRRTNGFDRLGALLDPARLLLRHLRFLRRVGRPPGIHRLGETPARQHGAGRRRTPGDAHAAQFELVSLDARRPPRTDAAGQPAGRRSPAARHLRDQRRRDALLERRRFRRARQSRRAHLRLRLQRRWRAHPLGIPQAHARAGPVPARALARSPRAVHCLPRTAPERQQRLSRLARSLVRHPGRHAHSPLAGHHAAAKPSHRRTPGKQFAGVDGLAPERRGAIPQVTDDLSAIDR